MEIEVSKIRRMKRLMTRLVDKTFDVDDKEELSTLSAYFLFTSKAMDYTDGYSLTKLPKPTPITNEDNLK